MKNWKRFYWKNVLFGAVLVVLLRMTDFFFARDVFRFEFESGWKMAIAHIMIDCAAIFFIFPFIYGNVFSQGKTSDPG